MFYTTKKTKTRSSLCSSCFSDFLFVWTPSLLKMGPDVNAQKNMCTKQFETFKSLFQFHMYTNLGFSTSFCWDSESNFLHWKHHKGQHGIYIYIYKNKNEVLCRRFVGQKNIIFSCGLCRIEMQPKEFLIFKKVRLRCKGFSN